MEPQSAGGLQGSNLPPQSCSFTLGLKRAWIVKVLQINNQKIQRAAFRQEVKPRGLQLCLHLHVERARIAWWINQKLQSELLSSLSMLYSTIMQYTCFPLFNYDKQTLWRACMSSLWCIMHGLGPRCGTGTACPACTVDHQGEKSLRSASAAPVWGNDLADLTWTWLSEKRSCLFCLPCQASVDRFAYGTYARILLVAEPPRLQLITQAERLAQDFCHMESHRSCSLCVQEQNNRKVCDRKAQFPCQRHPVSVSRNKGAWSNIVVLLLHFIVSFCCQATLSSSDRLLESFSSLISLIHWGLEETLKQGTTLSSSVIGSSSLSYHSSPNVNSASCLSARGC